MRIELANIEGGNSSFSHVYQPGDLAMGDPRIRLSFPLTISGTLKRESHKLRVSGELRASVQVECDRCLQLVEVPIESRFNLEYVTPEQYERAQVAELGEEDLDLSIFDGEILDIDEITYEQVMLAIPSQVLCREDCRGLCEACGANLNQQNCDCKIQEIDPRWAALRELKNQTP